MARPPASGSRAGPSRWRPPLKPIATLSLDLDDHWSYLKTHGDPAWESLPSYLDLVVPRILEFLRERRLRLTVFVVGQDAALAQNRQVLRSIAEAGHEIGNHSFRHEPWLHRYSEPEIEGELALAESAIEEATGIRPRGFRGPGYSLSAGTIRVLTRRAYAYDASTLPTFIGPLARAYYLVTARLTDGQRAQRDALFGHLRDGLRPVRSYRWRTAEGELLEIPVTTMPIVRIPVHVSYLIYLSGLAPAAALRYWRASLRLCRLTGTAPSLLLHPLDFLGTDEAAGLSFFPGMRLARERKLALVDTVLTDLTSQFQVLSLGEHARGLADTPLPVVDADTAFAA